MNDEEKLNNLFLKCINELESIGISFKNKKISIIISKRNNKRYGCCKPEIPDKNYKRVIRRSFKFIIKYENFKKYTIEISPWVLKLNDDIIKNTIIHELIHCLPKCNNHGLEFKKYAKYINGNLGYNITRVGDKKEDYNISNIYYNETENYKYKIKCKKCGQMFYRKRLNKNLFKKYRCSKCLR